MGQTASALRPRSSKSTTEISPSLAEPASENPDDSAIGNDYSLDLPMNACRAFSSRSPPATGSAHLWCVAVGSEWRGRAATASRSTRSQSSLASSPACSNLTRLKLRACRELTDDGMSIFANNCRNLHKFSCGSCRSGTQTRR
ncbi:VIER F-box protein 1 [Perilla frutescens var. hirtella]|nr:VIER F-box protein 1 [Perilla frutescens var. hirtella]